jgi:hypothetical protein
MLPALCLVDAPARMPPVLSRERLIPDPDATRNPVTGFDPYLREGAQNRDMLQLVSGIFRP